MFLFVLHSEEKKLIQKQMAFMLARQQIFLELDEDMEDYDELVEIMSNSLLNNNFLSLAREVCLTHVNWSVICVMHFLKHIVSHLLHSLISWNPKSLKTFTKLI